MTKQDYESLQNIITDLYESTKYKDYSSKERMGAKKFSLALKSKIKSIYKEEDLLK